MTKIQFNTEAYKTRSMEGPFPTLGALVQECETVALPNAEYSAWATANGVDDRSGSIVTTAYSPFYLQARQARLAEQLMGDYAAVALGCPEIKIPDGLQKAFSETVNELRDAKAPRILSLTTTRETLFFRLQEFCADTNMVCAAADQASANASNRLVQELAPQLSEKLSYQSRWQGQSFDLVHVNAAVIYKDEDGVRELVHDLASTGAERIVFSNIMPNKDEFGAARWFGQRSRGGIIPVRVPARGEIVSLMQQAGYKLVSEAAVAPTFNVDPTSSFTREYPDEQNLSFIRNPAL